MKPKSYSILIINSNRNNAAPMVITIIIATPYKFPVINTIKYYNKNHITFPLPIISQYSCNTYDGYYYPKLCKIPIKIIPNV